MADPRDDTAEFAWASRARKISLYLMKAGVASENHELLRGLDMGRACLRLSASRPLDMDLVRALVRSTPG